MFSLLIVIINSDNEHKTKGKVIFRKVSRD